ncbi:BZ3500_MvSof-1268-A1-R1_Chr2-2g05009 [Microbotryum saponariae]|uniref:BZ3500_MvSof-1268-A1-R1_Chr2-2g05009 protein n=1 Tax=Microbotryum saponariae TaxID=289078 RepID=A0A2X0L2C5_9BASI|nr:BZ3500_MvSof-1268-A1-R1_Chr2-2g05009 [Microbotryum saponariae]SDA00694.1 BZ3501_MvSof-1269-A2-R1_Chr2-2g04683 [Microbotryum saponariae]
MGIDHLCPSLLGCPDRDPSWSAVESASAEFRTGFEKSAFAADALTPILYSLLFLDETDELSTAIGFADPDCVGASWSPFADGAGLKRISDLDSDLDLDLDRVDQCEWGSIGSRSLSNIASLSKGRDMARDIGTRTPLITKPTRVQDDGGGSVAISHCPGNVRDTSTVQAEPPESIDTCDHAECHWLGERPDMRELEIPESQRFAVGGA